VLCVPLVCLLVLFKWLSRLCPAPPSPPWLGSAPTWDPQLVVKSDLPHLHSSPIPASFSPKLSPPVRCPFSLPYSVTYPASRPGCPSAPPPSAGTMPKMTLIGRLSDGLPLAASMADATDAYADELSNYDRDAKKLFRSLAAAATAGDSGRAGGAGGVAVTPNQFVTVGAGPAFAFHYLVDGGVVFLTLAEKAYPNRYAEGGAGVLGGGGAGAGRFFCVLGRWRRRCEGGEPMGLIGSVCDGAEGGGLARRVDGSGGGAVEASPQGGRGRLLAVAGRQRCAVNVCVLLRGGPPPSPHGGGDVRTAMMPTKGDGSGLT